MNLRNEMLRFDRLMILLGILTGGCCNVDLANAAGMNDNSSVVNWAINAINQTGSADFDKRCSTITIGLNADGTVNPSAKNNVTTDATAVTINPAADFPKTWIQSCRTITGTQLAEILQSANYNGQITIEGLYLVADKNSLLPSKSGGPFAVISLQNSDYKVSIKLAYSMINGRFYINNSHLISMDLEHVFFDGPLNAENLIVDDGLQINNIYFNTILDLRGLESPSFFWMGRVQSNPNSEGVMAQSMHVGGTFYYYGQIRVHNSDFSNSNFGRWFYFVHTVLHTGLQCRSCSIAGNLEFPSNSDLQNNQDDNVLNFSESEIKSDVAIECGAKIDNLNLRDTVIGGSFVTAGDNDCDYKINSLDLSEANISKRLDFSGLKPASWDFGQNNDSGEPLSNQLNLQNTKVNSFADCMSSWPPLFQIDGFTYNNIHDAYEDSCRNDWTPDKNEQHNNAVDWVAWLNRNNPTFDNSLTNKFWNNAKDLNQNFDPQPYTYLANYFQSEGLKGQANQIRYQSKFYEMKDAWRQGDYFAAFGTTVLWLVAGFGIGYKAVEHLLFVILGSIAIGVYFIRRSPVVIENNWKHLKFGRKSKFTYYWCIGACLGRLLPIIELRKEFTDFFEDEGNLTGFQKAFFVGYSLWGWFLGFLVLAVLTGLTQGS